MPPSPLNDTTLGGWEPMQGVKRLLIVAGLLGGGFSLGYSVGSLKAPVSPALVATAEAGCRREPLSRIGAPNHVIRRKRWRSSQGSVGCPLPLGPNRHKCCCHDQG